MGSVNEDEYIVNSITSREVEGGLDAFLYSFVLNGVAEKYGIVVIRGVPASRLRKSAKHTLSLRTMIPVHSCNVAEDDALRQAYSLTFAERPETMTWVHEAEKRESGEQEADLEDILKRLRSSERVGDQCVSIRSTPQGLRQGLGINTFPVSAPDGKFRELCLKVGYSHLYGSYINIATSGALIALQTSLAEVTTIYFNHKGSPRYWIVIAPRERQALEEKIREELMGGREGGCSQFVRHLRLWLDPSILERWGIRFTKVTQNALELLCMFPGSYYYGWCGGFSIMESKLYGGTRWSYKSYKFCVAARQDCVKDGLLVTFPEEGEMAGDCGEITRHGTTSGHGRKRKRRGDGGPELQGVSSMATDETESGIGLEAMGVGDSRDGSEERNVDGDGTIIITEGKERDIATLTESGERGYEVLVKESNDDFYISDDDEEAQTVDSERLLSLERENAAILRDLALARTERDNARARKGLYKSRLLQREELIEKLQERLKEVESLVEKRVKEAEYRSWTEMMSIARSKVDGMDKSI